MIGSQQLREAARPQGIISQGCRRCALLDRCGGIEPIKALFDCFGHYCCNGEDDCDEVCPYNRDFSRRMAEVGGLQFGDVALLMQPRLELPRYVPLIHHGYSHRAVLDLPIVALDTYDLFRLKDNALRSISCDAAQLREEFGLSQHTRILLRGTAKDRRLERYWSYRRRDKIPQEIARLGIDLAIAPNFSHFLDVPRTDNLFNRKRQLICVTELDEAGICAVPHLSAVTPGDWRFWTSYIERNESVKYVAAEFQTGNKNPVEGRLVIQHVAGIQDVVGRALHPLIIGGTQFVRDVARKFADFTFIDSCPFMKAVKRRRFEKGSANGRWGETFTLVGQGIEDVILRNVAGHAAWIDEQSSVAGNRREVMPIERV